MKIVFTGSGSFTGYWIIKELVSNGHEVYPLFEEKIENTSGVRKIRLGKISKITKCYFGINYGSDVFYEFISSLGKIDVFSQHFFDTKDYKNKDYNIIKSLSNSVGDPIKLFDILSKIDCKKFILTGSSFEEGEGVGDDVLIPFSPYGLSKSISSKIFSYYCKLYGIKFYKFVIPNPFGPFEEYKFTSYLADSWLKGKIPVIKTPDYIRDNVPVDLLAKAYSYMVSNIYEDNFSYKMNPSGYIESNLDFVKRFSLELSKRFNLPCEFHIEKQNSFDEPKVRYNTDNLFNIFKEYEEVVFWDNLALYYKKIYGN